MNELGNFILQILLRQDMPITSKQLSLLSDASINTVRKEIDFINEEIEPYGFKITSKKSIGHEIEIMDEQKASPILRQWKYFFERSDYADLRSSKQAYYISQRLFAENEMVTIDKLAQELSFLPIDVKKELRGIKKGLAYFHLTLVNSHQKGLFIKGNEWDKRQCLLYQHKTYRLFQHIEKTEEEGTWNGSTLVK